VLVLELVLGQCWINRAVTNTGVQYAGCAGFSANFDSVKKYDASLLLELIEKTQI
jgi:hypothetical protein